MPVQTSQSINDGKATPVAHVFAPFGVTAASKQGEYIATYMNRAASSLTGGAESFQVYIRPKKSDGGFSLRGTVSLPITESVSGVNAVTRVLSGSFSFNIPPNATLAERTDLRAIMTGIISSGSNVGLAVVNAEPIT